MTHRSICIGLLGVATLAVLGSAQDAPIEAPAGFDTPTLVQNAGLKAGAMGSWNLPVIRLLSTNKLSKQHMMPARGSAPFSTHVLARIVIRIR